MAGEWKDLTLGDLGRVVTGKTPLTAVEGNFGGQIPFVTPSDMDGRKTISTTARYLTETGAASVKGSVIPAGAIMVSCIGSDMGKVVIAGRDCVTNQQINSIVVDGRFSSEFVYYTLSTRKNEIRHQAAGGSAVPILNKGDFSRMEITLPPLAEQKAIAAVLGTLDDKIELNSRMNATLEAMAQALFQSWFVDFDPVRAKLEGREPAALDPTTAALFPNSFQESSLGPIPHGWEVCPLSDKIQLLSGGTPKTSEPTYWDGDIPWYSVRDAPSETDVWVIHTDKHVTKLGIANSAAQIFPEKTTIISARGTVGKLALTAVPMAMNQSCYGVRGITSYGNYFTYYSLREATTQLQQRTHGTVFDTITTGTFKTLDCIFPMPKITAAFDKLVEPLLGQIRANLHQSRTLATLRDTLLPKLLSGELSVIGEKVSKSTCVPI
jgi:type I restriction enzyme S subunit